ncbi:MAG: V-type ATP synthase subunit E family protein, partial [Pseudomonadota bacterium]
MPIWGDVELLCRGIRTAGRKEAEAVLNRARVEAEEIVTAARDAAGRDFAAQAHAYRSQACAEAGRMKDSAELEARQKITAFREQTMELILDTVKARLNALRAGPGYLDFLTAALVEGLERLPVREFIVELDGRDLAAVTERIAELAERRSLKIETVPVQMEGGCRIFTADRGLDYDNTLSARFKRLEEEIRRE